MTPVTWMPRSQVVVSPAEFSASIVAVYTPASARASRFELERRRVTDTGRRGERPGGEAASGCHVVGDQRHVDDGVVGVAGRDRGRGGDALVGDEGRPAVDDERLRRHRRRSWRCGNRGSSMSSCAKHVPLDRRIERDPSESVSPAHTVALRTNVSF